MFSDLIRIRMNDVAGRYSDSAKQFSAEDRRDPDPARHK
jgi:hypothetical protein